MPTYVEDGCQLQNLIKVSFPDIILHWGGAVFKKCLLKIFRVREKAKLFQNENVNTALILGWPSIASLIFPGPALLFQMKMHDQCMLSPLYGFAQHFLQEVNKTFFYNSSIIKNKKIHTSNFNDCINSHGKGFVAPHCTGSTTGFTVTVS